MPTMFRDTTKQNTLRSIVNTQDQHEKRALLQEFISREELELGSRGAFIDRARSILFHLDHPSAGVLQPRQLFP